MSIILIIECISICFETFIFIYLIDNSFKRRYFSKYVWVLLLSILQMIQHIVFGKIGLISIIPTMTFDLAVTFCGYAGKLRKKIFFVILFYSLSIVFDTFSELLMTGLYALIDITPFIISEWPIPTLILSKISLLLVVILIGKSLRIETDLKDWLWFAPVPMVV